MERQDRDRCDDDETDDKTENCEVCVSQNQQERTHLNDTDEIEEKPTV